METRHREHLLSPQKEFEDAWNEQSSKLRSLFERTVRDDPDEVHSRTAYIAFLKYSQCNSNYASWLRKLAKNVCNDYHREKARARADSIDDAENGPAIEDQLRGGPDPEHALIAREQGAIAMLHGLMCLPPIYRDPLLLITFQESTPREIAAHLGITEVNVRKRISTAREKLREVLAHPPKRRLEIPRCVNLWKLGEHLANQVTGRPARLPDTKSIVTVSVTLPSGVERDDDIQADGPIDAASHAELDTLRKYVRKHSRGTTKALELARALRSRGEYVEAAELYLSVIQRRPDFVAAGIEGAAVCRFLGRTADAITAYERVFAKCTDRDRTIIEALIEWTAGHHDAALAFLDKLMTPGALDGLAARYAGEIALDRGRIDDALRCLIAATDARPDDSIAFTLLHDARVAAGETVAASDAVRKAVAADGDNVPALTRLVRILIKEISTEADVRLADLGRLAPDHAGTVECIAAALLASGHEGEAAARAHMQNFLHRHPMHARAWLAYARVLSESRSISLAHSAAITALETDMMDREVRVGAVALLARVGPDSEWPLLVATLTDLRTDVRAMIAVGTALLDAERGASQALDLAQRALELQPELVPARRLARRALAILGEPF